LIFGRGRRRFPDPAPHQKTKLSRVKYSVVKERALVPQSHHLSRFRSILVKALAAFYLKMGVNGHLNTSSLASHRFPAVALFRAKGLAKN